MTVSQVNVSAMAVVSQNQAGMKADSREKFLYRAVAAGIGVTMTGGKVSITFHHIVITVKHKKPVITIKAGEHPETVVMSEFNWLYRVVFPKFVPVTEFNIGESVIIIILQCGKIKMLVFEKIIAGCPDSPVAVAEEDVAALGSQWENGYIFESLIKPMERTYEQEPSFLHGFVQRRTKRPDFPR